MQPVNLCDRLTFERCRGAVELSCSDATLPGSMPHGGTPAPC